jgi:hypothetical protein
MADLTPVLAQLDAYNAGDVERFLAWYALDVVVEDGAGTQLMQGRERMRSEYPPFFAEYPDLRGEIVHRITAGDYVIDEELIHGWQAEPVRAVAIYHVTNGLIDHVRLIDG